MSKSTEKRTVKDPKLSVNKLAEYLSADSSRRKRILIQAKHPDKYIVTRYDDVKDVLTNFLTNKVTKTEVQNKIKEFQATAIAAEKKKEDWQKQKFNNAAQALEAFMKFTMPTLKGVNFESYNATGKYLIIKGVKISVAPDIILTKPGDDVDQIGSVKFNLTKTTPLSDEGQRVVGVALYKFVDRHIGNEGDITLPKLCISIDVIKGAHQFCPDSMTKRWEKIQDACEEIAVRWDSL